MLRRVYGRSLGWVAVAALGAAVLAVPSGYGAERMVLGEYFTATW